MTTTITIRPSTPDPAPMISFIGSCGVAAGLSLRWNATSGLKAKGSSATAGCSITSLGSLLA